MGRKCQLELCRPESCSNEGICRNGEEGFECTCPLPWVGEYCEDKVKVLQFRPSSRASVPLIQTSEKGISFRFGLKITDLESEQQVFEQSTTLGLISVVLVGSKVRLTMEDTVLELPLLDTFETVSVTLVDRFLELVVGNQTDVHVFSELQDVSANDNLMLGAVHSSTKRSALGSFTGCLVDIDNIGIVNMAEGEGFSECGEDDYYTPGPDNLELGGAPTEEPRAPCENGAVQIGPYCQCPEGFYGDLCDIPEDESCQSLECPGECRETSRGAQCVCSWPSEGEQCTDLTLIPSFRADSSLTFTADRYRKFSEPVYGFMLDLNPEYPRGYIAMFQGSNGFCSLHLDELLYFECVQDGAVVVSVQHQRPLQVDQWSLVEANFNHQTLSLSLDGEIELFNIPDLQSLNLDGSIVLGSKPGDVDISGTILADTSVPGFFGEIHPISVNGDPVKLEGSTGRNLVSAKSRDADEPFQSPCASNPCGAGNECFVRARGYTCKCQSNTGKDCTDTADLLTFYGQEGSYAEFDTQYDDDSNALRIRFNSESEDGLLLYGASRFKDGAVPSSLFFVALHEGEVIAGVYEQPDTFYKLHVPVDATDGWQTVYFELTHQKASLSLHESWESGPVDRLKFPFSFGRDIVSKARLFVGGYKDSAVLEKIASLAGISVAPFFGQVSAVGLNKESLMGDIDTLEGVTVGGKPPVCADNPCASGKCIGNGQCLCDNALRSGPLCEKIISFTPIRISDGYVTFPDNFGVDTEIFIDYQITGENQAVLFHIKPLFTGDIEPIEFIFPPTTDGQNITIRRTRKEVIVKNGDGKILSTVPVGPTIKLDRHFHIGLSSEGLPFSGQVFSVLVDGVEAEPVAGRELTQGRYPPCYTDPCLNGARCREVSNTEFRCECTAGFSGQYCNLLADMCDPFPCNQGERWVTGVFLYFKEINVFIYFTFLNAK